MVTKTVDGASARKGKQWIGIAIVIILSVLAWLGLLLIVLYGSMDVRSFLSSIAIMPSILLIMSIIVHVRSPPSGRQFLSNRLTTGFLAGLSATFCLDVSELLLYSAGVAEFSVIMQGMLTNPQSVAWVTVLVGIMYHFIYFTTIGMFYAMIAGKSKWFYGLAWILLMELYELNEFLTFAGIKYLVYGIVLGILVQRLTQR